MLAQAGLFSRSVKQNELMYIALDRAVNSLIGNDHGMILDDENQSAREHYALTKFASMLFALRDITDVSSYRCYMCEEKKKTSGGSFAGTNRVLNAWCMVPGIALRELNELSRSIILTSGTLTPFTSFKLELQMHFNIQLENNHVVKPEQICFMCLTKGALKQRMNSKYENRTNISYINDVGASICNVSRVVPYGMLVFFPSYYLMDHFLDKWNDKAPGAKLSTIDRLNESKRVFTESRKGGNAAIQELSDAYKGCVDRGEGAILFAVMRGKASEGVDFADRYGRCVIVIGIPYASFVDPHVKIKRKFLDEQNRQTNIKGLNGNDWFQLGAARAVNQALGRVIRHQKDFGAMILMDERYARPDTRKLITKWLHPYYGVHRTFGDGIKKLQNFFDNAENKGWDVMPERNVSRVDKCTSKKHDRTKRLARLLVEYDEPATVALSKDFSIEPDLGDRSKARKTKRICKIDNLAFKRGEGSLLEVLKSDRKKVENFNASDALKELDKNNKKKIFFGKKKFKKVENLANLSALTAIKNEDAKKGDAKKKERIQKRKEISDKIVARCTKEELGLFQEILKSIKGTKTESETTFETNIFSNVKKLLKKKDDLLEEFLIFMPKSYKD
eukprot:UN25361